MKNAIKHYAKCNKVINAKMLEIIRKKLKDPLEIQLKGYFFKTLGELLEHIYVSDMMWMNAFLEIRDYGIKIVDEVGPIPAYGDKVFDDFDKYQANRLKLDDLIVKYSQKFENEIFDKTVSRVNRKGEKMERKLWIALMHFFNHQTHHRGQISNILDEMNIENDYSNMITIE